LWQGDIAVIERLGVLVFTYLLGWAILQFGWACVRQPPTREQVARWIVLFGAGTFLALLVMETAAAVVAPGPAFSCNCFDCWPTPMPPASSSFGMSPLPTRFGR
jgi:hypothetical protein